VYMEGVRENQGRLFSTTIDKERTLVMGKGKYGYDCTNCPANVGGACKEDDCPLKQSPPRPTE